MRYSFDDWVFAVVRAFPIWILGISIIVIMYKRKPK